MYEKEIQELKKEIEWPQEQVNFLLEKYFEQNPPEDEE